MALPEKEVEADDPMELVGVFLPGSDEQMAECFVEEFLLMGYSDEEVLGLFRDPFYTGVHRIYRGRGEPYVQDLIRRVRGIWTGE